MSVDEFRDDDRGYLAWTTAHPDGYVINIQRSLNPADARLHRADCYTINGHPARGQTWTGPYIKVCSTSVRDVREWAREHVRAGILGCGVCKPPVYRTADEDVCSGLGATAGSSALMRCSLDGHG